jgi:hypothetical protein
MALKKYRAWIIAALVLGASSLILESSSTFQECIHNTKNKEGEYAAQKGVAKIAKIYSIRRDCIGLFLHKNGEAITALFTVVLAFSTIALWLSTRELWRVTDKTLEHSEDTARKQLRAYMSAEPDGVILFNPPDRVVGRVRFLNTGAVFAKDVRSKVKKQLSENGDLPEEAFPIDESELTGDNVIAPRAGRAKSRASDATPATSHTLKLTNSAQGASSGSPLEFTPRKRGGNGRGLLAPVSWLNCGTGCLRIPAPAVTRYDRYARPSPDTARDAA